MRNISISLILGMLCSLTIQAADAPCLRYDANIPLSSLDSRLGFTGNDIIRDFNNASQSGLFTWEDGTVTSAHWEFLPDSDSARIFIADYDDNCSSNVSWLDVKGVLSLRTSDGRINARWNVLLYSLLGGLDTANIVLTIESQELQGLPELLEGEHEKTYIDISVRDGQLDGAIFRSYLTQIPIIDEDGPTPPLYARKLASVGQGLDMPGFIWEKP